MALNEDGRDAFGANSASEMPAALHWPNLRGASVLVDFDIGEAMTHLDLWTLGNASPLKSAQRAIRAEESGWAGIAVVDSQNLNGDSYVALTLMSEATERIGLSTGVTNPVTRHPAVTAAAAQSIAVLSDGRMTLGIGRGDSALAHIGRAPATVKFMERYVVALRRYLDGEHIAFSDLGFQEKLAPEVGTLDLAHTPDDSRLMWVQPGDPEVSIEAAATGPRMIAAAARSANRVIFALGADTDRLNWGIDVARQARTEAGLDPDGIEFGAYVNIVAHPDIDMARKLVSGGLSTFARFSVMHGTVSGPANDMQRKVFADLDANYDMNSHTRTDSAQAQLLTDDFIDQYAIVGDGPRCIDRLETLAEVGLSKIIVIGPMAGADREQARFAEQHLASDVLPVFAK